jgi:hypothetical protein
VQLGNVAHEDPNPQLYVTFDPVVALLPYVIYLTVFGVSDPRITLGLERGYTRDRLPAYSFVLRARAMVLMGERTLSDTSGARQ